MNECAGSLCLFPPGLFSAPPWWQSTSKSHFTAHIPSRAPESSAPVSSLSLRSCSLCDRLLVFPSPCPLPLHQDVVIATPGS